MRQERRIARVELPFRPIGEYPIPIRREETIVLPAAQDEPGAERNQFGGKGERGLGAAPQTRAREKMLERVARNMEPRRQEFLDRFDKGHGLPHDRRVILHENRQGNKPATQAIVSKRRLSKLETR